MNTHLWNKWKSERARVLSALLTGTLALSGGTAFAVNEEEAIAAQPVAETAATEDSAASVATNTDTNIATEESADEIAPAETDEAEQTNTSTVRAEESAAIQAALQEISPKKNTQVIEEAVPEMTEEELEAQALASCQKLLKKLGLVKVTGTRNVTRRQAVVVAVRLLGASKTAQQKLYSHPYRDVGSDCQSYIGYAYYTGLASGTSATKFSPDRTESAATFMTYVLKALGYTGVKDSNSMKKAVSVGLCSKTQASDWNAQPLNRQSMSEMTYLALNTNLASQGCTLATKLAKQGVIDKGIATDGGLAVKGSYVQTKASALAAKVTKVKVAAGTYSIISTKNKKAVTCTGTSKQSAVEVRTNTRAKTQKFKIVKGEGNTFQIKSTASSYYLDAKPTSGTDVLLWRKNDTDCQSFCAVKGKNGAYSLRSASNPDLALTAASDGDLTLKTYSDAASQQWKLSSGEEDTEQASEKLASIMKTYPSGTNMGSSFSFAGARQCMAFGRLVFSKMYGTTARWNYNGTGKTTSDSKKFTVAAKTSSYASSSVRTAVSKAKPGDILQMGAPKMHTMVYVSQDSTGFTVYDCNWVGSNRVSVRHVSYGAWSGRNSSGLSVLHATNYPKG